MRRLLIALLCFNGLACLIHAADSLPIRQASDSSQELRRDTQDRPNIVFVITDDQRCDQLSYTGHPVLKRLTSTALPKKALPSIISLWLPRCARRVGPVF